jgi:predicted RNase H-like nuclease (RuvC/YqgF family)
MCSYFDPEARDKREHDQRMLTLYAIQLQDAQTTIHRLEDEVSKLRKGVNIQLIRLQEENSRLQQQLSDAQNKLQQAHRELNDRANENSNLRNRVKNLQLRIDLLTQQMMHRAQQQPAWGGGTMPHQSNEGHAMGMPSMAGMTQNYHPHTVPNPMSGDSLNIPPQTQ